MRLLFWLTLLLLVLIKFPGLLKAEMNCLDNSYHLTKPYDYKNYHFVACTCPCTEYQNFENRGQCQQCLHFHVPRNWKVIRGNKVVMRIQQAKPVHSQEQVAVSPKTRAIIKKMIANYKKQK